MLATALSLCSCPDHSRLLPTCTDLSHGLVLTGNRWCRGFGLQTRTHASSRSSSTETMMTGHGGHLGAQEQASTQRESAVHSYPLITGGSANGSASGGGSGAGGPWYPLVGAGESVAGGAGSESVGHAHMLGSDESTPRATPSKRTKPPRLDPPAPVMRDAVQGAVSYPLRSDMSQWKANALDSSSASFSVPMGNDSLLKVESPTKKGPPPVAPPRKSSGTAELQPSVGRFIQKFGGKTSRGGEGQARDGKREHEALAVKDGDEVVL